MLAQVLNGKVAIQAQVQHFLALRAAAKEQRASSLMGAAGSMGGGAALGSTRGGGGAGGLRMANPEAQLQSCMAELVGALWGASKPEEGGSVLGADAMLCWQPASRCCLPACLLRCVAC